MSRILAPRFLIVFRSLLCLAVIALQLRKMAKKRKRAVVLCLGDIGRSPRMQYHALSLANTAQMKVDIVAYGGSKPQPDVTSNPNIRQHLILPFPWNPPRAFFLLYVPLKVMMQLFQLFWMLLMTLPAYDYILVQNPPSIPTLMVAKISCLLRCASLVIDWHNYGYTILGISLGRSHWLVRLAEAFERLWGRTANANFCVTKAMQRDLRDNWGIAAAVLYDRPPRFFRSFSLQEQHELWTRLEKEGIFQGLLDEWPFTRAFSYRRAASFLPSSPSYTSLSSLSTVKRSARKKGRSKTSQRLRRSSRRKGKGGFVALARDSESDDSLSDASSSSCLMDGPEGSQPQVIEESSFTRLVRLPGGGREVQRRPGRPALVVSSTSWTADEDFSLLLDAIVDYEEAASNDDALPKVLFVITGKGPLKAAFEEKVGSLELFHTRVATVWLKAEDYPRLLGCADLGVSLHSSSSGLDLPMKVVDMFGCGLPVVALDFPCLHELVVSGKAGGNGRTFTTSIQLASHLQDLLRGGLPGRGSSNGSGTSRSEPGTPTRHRRATPLVKMRAALRAFQAVRWDDAWGDTALPFFSHKT